MARADVIIENGTIVTEGGRFTADLVIADQQIAALTNNASGWEAGERIDATGLWLLPGGIDVHTHLREPDPELLEGFARGGAGAAAGGLTTVVEMPQAHPTTVTPEQFREKQRLVAEHAIVDMALWAGAIGPPKQTADDLAGMAEAGAAAFKSFMATSSPLFPAIDYGQLHWAMREAARLGLPYGLHAEDQALLADGLQRMRAVGRTDPLAHAESRPPLVETVAVNTALLLAAETGCHVHICHVASAGALALIHEAKARGQRVTAETCPQYLMLNTDDLERLAGFARCAPAIRDQAEVDAIWEFVHDGTIDIICSDHCPFTIESKEAGRNDIFAAPLGLSGVQTLLPAFFSEAVVRRGMAPERFVAMMAGNPARVFGLTPRKGTLAVGADADVTLLDPEATWTVSAGEALHGQKWTPYEGMTLTGRVRRTIRRGETIYDDTREGEERVTARPGSGTFLPRGYGELA
ncbi:MAG: allantoinase AllB [Thermomicrobiales bacterium]|nr:allantoinase AllB [Thermomicrobiales bacterium]